MDKTQLVKLAGAFAAHRGLKLSTVSTYVAGDGKFFRKLEEGPASCTLARAQRIIRWFSDNWPEDLAWPADIPRPAQSPKSKVA